ncbi:MAG: TerC/Alx family metal homeostasis membrane protein [Bacteroidetes bacterium]|nr:TerC/Alx family metal homeostasis membrane protein [Bacteroidota bacterium]
MSENFLLLIFAVVIIICLIFDLGVFNKKQHVLSTKEATIWTLVWIVLALLFGVFIFYEFGNVKATEYFAAYLTEKSLSLDNIFVFVLIFSYYNVPEEFKHRILFWGILGAVILRAIFIFVGVELIKLTYLPPVELFGKEIEFNVLLIIFGIILILTGLKTFIVHKENENKDFSDNFIMKVLKKRFPISNNIQSGSFTIIENGKRCITPLLLCLITIELSDVIFAVDSIPAVFGITQDPIILYTSNIFAILGLRSMYFMLSSIIAYFKRLSFGISVILLYIGVKMLISQVYHIDAIISLSIIISILLLSILWSIIEKKK